MSLPPGARDARPVGGGDINQAYRVTLADGRQAFVKTRPDAAPGEYAAEAAGLRWLAEPGALRTPAVIEVGEDYLALEWVRPGSLSEVGAEQLGAGLALTHLAGAPRFGEPAFVPAGAAGFTNGDAAAGADGDDTAPLAAGFGSLRLPNDPAPDWPTFYAERRLGPLAGIARDRGALRDAGARAVEDVCARLPELAGPKEPPARLHGDLWSGNVMADTDGRPWLIDPSCYGGHREIDLAMLRLFGAPSPRVFDAYEELAPLAEGWEERVQLWQLLPLLVHAVLFGGSYREAAERAARRYAG
ncbi:MAG TPA: fructosamine kinase family protein [Solirubrobacteraceae bacterium]|nr:fructosamine kinase family protein [Solirubrobacteraceae bacterium]